MKNLLVLCVVTAAVLAEEKYTDKYDNVNIDEILENERLLLGYTDCMMDKGKCTSEGTELKGHIQDALETGCSKCTEKQQELTVKVIKHLTEKKPAIWNELAAKFDPEGKWRKTYEQRAREYNINLPK